MVIRHRFLLFVIEPLAAGRSEVTYDPIKTKWNRLLGSEGTHSPGFP